MRRLVALASALGPTCDGIGPCAPRFGHVTDQPRRIRHAYRRRLPSQNLLDHRLLQERAVARGRPLSQARRSDLVDVEGRETTPGRWPIIVSCGSAVRLQASFVVT